MTPDFNIQKFRDMRASIVERYCEALESQRDTLLHCREQLLAEKVKEVFVAGGAPLSHYEDMEDLVRWAIVGAQSFLQHAVEQRLMFLGNFEGEQARTEAAAKLEFESWVLGSKVGATRRRHEHLRENRA